jgi:hypothetical protein
MRSILFVVSAFAIFVTFALRVYGAPGESIVLDPKTGDYQITYLGTGSPGNKKDRPLRKTIFVPSTKINPAIGSSLKLWGADSVVYSYRVKNGPTSRQALDSLFLDPVTDIVSAQPLPKRNEDVDINTIAQIDMIGRDSLTTPRGWDGSAVTSDLGGLRIGWVYAKANTSTSGLLAGSIQDGFGFSSKDIAGIGIAQLSGYSPILGFADEGPSGEISDQLDKLTRNDFVSRNAAVPAIVVPSPFDEALLLDRIRTEMQTWPGKQLLDASYSAKLDAYLSSAANAFRMSQPKVGREQIETVRKLLAKEHHYLDQDEDHEDTDEHKTATRFTIDRLAARVLDFDLRYVLKRMEKEHERDHDENDRRKER